jgi:hypothetical protein
MFQSEQPLNGQLHTLIGVVLGQRDGPFIQAGLTAAQQMVDSVAPQLAHPH